MERKEKEWLPHIEGFIPKEAYGYKVSAYSIALEAWRRGITLKYINFKRKNNINHFTLTYKGKEHFFAGSRGDKVTKKALTICVNKQMTKEYLKNQNVPVPEGDIFQPSSSIDDIVDYGDNLGYPLVIKPTSSSGGKGVISNIQSKGALSEAANYIKKEFKSSDIIVEKYITGKDLRVYVIGDKIVGVITRVPATIVGNGTDNIKQLIRQKNNERNLNPALYNNPIKIDEDLRSMLRLRGYTLESVPQSGEKVVLKSTSNISAGGDPIDTTEILTPEAEEIIHQAVRAIPGLFQAGVDVIFDKSTNRCVIIEVNSKPSIRSHLFPIYGKARDIPKAIIDHYFPETKGSINTDIPYYIGVNQVINIFRDGLVKEIVIQSIPIATNDSVHLKVRNLSLTSKYLKIRASELQLNGFVKQESENSFTIVVSGDSENVNSFIQMVKSQTNIYEKKQYKKPVKIGFEIIEEINHNYKEYQALKKERDYYRKEFEKINDSRSWKITKSLRKIGGIFKGK